MLPRQHRLTSSADFTAATRRGRRAGTATLVLHLTGAGPEFDGPVAAPRVGLVVSKAVGNAVTRNRVSRRVRHLVRSRIDLLPDAALLVVRALPAAAEASSVVLARDLDKALGRLVPRAGDLR